MPPEPNLHDALFRSVFANPEHAGPLLRWLLPAALREAIDWTTLRAEPELLVATGLSAVELDVLLSATGRHGGAYVFVVLEHKAQRRRFTALQMLGYVHRLWERWHRDQPGRPLPVVLPVVVHHGARPWRSPTSIAGLLDWRTIAQLAGGDALLMTALAALQPQFGFLLDDLAVVSEAELLARPLSQRGLLTLLYQQFVRGQPAAAVVAALRRWQPLLAAAYAGPGGGDWLLQLHSYALHTSDLPQDQLAAVLAEIVTSEEAMKIVTTAERLRAEGKAEGKAEGLRATLLRQLDRRFGPVPPAAAQRIAGAAVEQLDRWLDRVLEAGSLDEVLAG